MAKTFNEQRCVTGRLGVKTVTQFGRQWAIDDNLDGYSIIDVETVQPPVEVLKFLNGDTAVLVYPLASNVNKLCNYCLASFPNITTIYLFSSTLVTLESNAFGGLSNLAYIYVPSSLVNTYKTTYPQYASLFLGLASDYEWNVPLLPQQITTELFNSLVSMLSGGQKSAISKITFNSGYNESDVVNVAWSYNFGLEFPNLNNNVYYGTTKLDFSNLVIEGSGTLTAEIIGAKLTGNLYLTSIKEIKFSGYSDMSAGLSYDYSALTNLEYVWLENTQYEYDSQTSQWVIKAIFYPLNTFIANISDKAVAYFDYTGTAPDMSAFTGWSYEWYDNASRTGSPVAVMQNGKRYYLQLKPLNNSITILGSGTLTSAMVNGSVGQLTSADKLLVARLKWNNNLMKLHFLNDIKTYLPSLTKINIFGIDYDLPDISLYEVFDYVNSNGKSAASSILIQTGQVESRIRYFAYVNSQQSTSDRYVVGGSDRNFGIGFNANYIRLFNRDIGDLNLYFNEYPVNIYQKDMFIDFVMSTTEDTLNATIGNITKSQTTRSGMASGAGKMTFFDAQPVTWPPSDTKLYYYDFEQQTTSAFFIPIKNKANNQYGFLDLVGGTITTTTNWLGGND